MEPPSSNYIYLMVITIAFAADQSLMIALATKKLTKVKAKVAIVLAVFAAVAMRAVATLGLLEIEHSIPVKLCGGILLIGFLIWQMITESKQKEAKTSFWGVVMAILVADAVMSLDNTFALVGLTTDLDMLKFGVWINIPVLLITSFIAECLVRRFKVVFIGATAFLVGTAGYLIMTDKIISFPHPIFAAIAIGVAAFCFGIQKQKEKGKIEGRKKPEAECVFIIKQTCNQV